VCERFFWSLKHEWTNRMTLADLDAARASVFNYITRFYNRQRKPQTLGDVALNHYEATFAAERSPAA
jgi:putative transposase